MYDSPSNDGRSICQKIFVKLKNVVFFFRYYSATCITLWPDLALKNIVPFILLLTNVIFLLFIVILHSAMTLFRFVKARISTVM